MDSAMGRHRAMCVRDLKPQSVRRAALWAWWLGALGVLSPSQAHAHFLLQDPASYDVLDPVTGLPEKLGPCGNETPQTLTNVVTAFQEGQSITITIDEVVFHPGHYRVALAMTADHMQASFPDDPVVTPGLTNSGTMVCPAPTDMSACGSVPVEPPVFPVLADNLFEHCAMFTEPQSVTLKLPAGVTCDKCTLQVLEFMSDHGPNVPGGCFYHHCADISIGVQTVSVDGGAPNDAGVVVPTSKSQSSGCSASAVRPRRLEAALAGLVLAAGLWRVRRATLTRRRPSPR